MTTNSTPPEPTFNENWDTVAGLFAFDTAKTLEAELAFTSSRRTQRFYGDTK